MTRELTVFDEAWPLVRPFAISRGVKTEAHVVVAEIQVADAVPVLDDLGEREPALGTEVAVSEPQRVDLDVGARQPVDERAYCLGCAEPWVLVERHLAKFERAGRLRFFARLFLVVSHRLGKRARAVCGEVVAIEYQYCHATDQRLALFHFLCTGS